MIYFPDRSRVGGVSFLENSVSPNDPVMKAWEYVIVVYLKEILNPKYSFFSRLTKLQRCMFRRIY